MADNLTASEVIDEELSEIKTSLPEIDGVQLIACVPESVRVHIRCSDQKQVTMCIQFPEQYPHQPLVVELKSKKFSDKLLGTLTKICDEALKTVISKKQIVHIVQFMHTFLDENPLVVCSDEISTIKRDLLSTDDIIRLKQKTSQIVFHIKSGRYFLKFTLTVPYGYPEEPVDIEIRDHNFPSLLYRNFVGQSQEITRSCTQPPLKPKPKDPPFKPRPSVLPLCRFLISDCVHYYPNQKCPLCKKLVLSEDPSESTRDPTKVLVRVYCSHCFHYGCVDEYMKTPPFTGGKACPGCGKRIFHEDWKISPEVAEARWAHKQARDRELEEVVDFLYHIQ